ncbi:MAG: cytochrome c oxidase subunit II [Chloroflexi bacterium]|nr:cytochrome c oxidase subunit II [Chloroflexota bacterium]
MTQSPHPASTQQRRSRLRSPFVWLLIATVAFIAAGCNAYPQNIFEPKSEFAQTLDDLFKLILWAAAFVFVVVEGALVYAAIKHRARPGDPLPKQVHGNKYLEIAWTVLPAIVLGVILVPSTQAIFETQAPAPADSLKVRVIGHQFWWEFEYLDLGVRTANEIRMPIGRTLSLEETSADVIHSFWIPALGGKRDVVPGRTNFLWWTPRETGTFPGQCAELCGYSHANMRMRGIVQTQAEFDAWVEQQKAPAQVPPPNTDAAKGAELVQQRCASCHAIGGTAAQARVGPDLTHLASRTTIAAGVLDNTPENLKRWISDPSAIKPGALMPKLGLTDDELNQVVAYLSQLQ